MNKVGATPNGPGPTMAEQAKFVNGRGSRLIGAADPDYLFKADNFAALRRYEQKLDHLHRELATAQRLGKVIGTASR